MLSEIHYMYIIPTINNIKLYVTYDMHVPRNTIIKRCSISRFANPVLERIAFTRTSPNPKLVQTEVNYTNKKYSNWLGLTDMKNALRTRRRRYNMLWLKMTLGLKTKGTNFKDSRFQTRINHIENLKNTPTYQNDQTAISGSSSNLKGRISAFYKQYSNPQKQKESFYKKVRVQSLIVRARR